MGTIRQISKYKWLVNIFLYLGTLYFLIYPQVLGGDCNINNPDCGIDSYCGIDNKCYNFPFDEELVEEREKTESEHPIFFPIVLSFILIGGAFLYKKHDQK